MAEKDKGASQQKKRYPLDDLAQLTLIPFLCGAGQYGLFRVMEPLTGIGVQESLAVSGFITLLAGIVVTAFKEATNRKEEKRRWKEQRDLLKEIRDRL